MCDRAFLPRLRLRSASDHLREHFAPMRSARLRGGPRRLRTRVAQRACEELRTAETNSISRRSQGNICIGFQAGAQK
jgi:hypothetical protein